MNDYKANEHYNKIAELLEKSDGILEEMLEIEEALEYHQEEISSLEKRKSLLSERLEKISNGFGE